MTDDKMEPVADFVPLQDRLKQIFDDAGGSDTLADLLREFDFEGSRELADAIVLGIARPAPVDDDVDALTGCADDFLSGTAEQWRNAVAPVVEDGLVERSASEIANEICGCANRDQHRRDIALIEEVRAQAYAKGVVTALRAQSEGEAERDRLRAGLRFALGFVPPPGDDATDGYRSRYNLARQALERSAK